MAALDGVTAPHLGEDRIDEGVVHERSRKGKFANYRLGSMERRNYDAAATL
jgi:hypothetical protein